MKKPLKLCRTFENNEIENNKVASDNDNVFVSLSNGKIFSIEKNTTYIKWQTDLGGKIILQPLVSNNNLVVLSANNKNDENHPNIILRMINKDNGLVNWQAVIETKNKTQKLNDDDENQTAAVYATSDKIFLSLNNALFLINLNSGDIISQKYIEEKISSKPFYSADQIVFGTEGKRIQILSNENLKEIKSLQVSSVPKAAQLLRDKLIWADDAGNLFAISNIYNVSKQKRLFRAGGRILNVSAFDKGYLITSLDNFVYFVSTETGEVSWKKRLAGRPENEPSVFENYVLIQTVGDLTAWIIELKSGDLANRIDLSGDNFFIGSIGIASPYILLQTNKGILFYTSKEYCS